MEAFLADENVTALYDAPPIWAKMAAGLLLGVAIIVLLPIMLIRGDDWLLLLIVPLILIGLVLLSFRLRIALIRPTSVVRVTKSFLGLCLRQQQFAPADVAALEIDRVAGDDRERDSDTWYLRIRLRNRGYTIGKYDNRMSALLARRDVGEALRSLQSAPVPEAGAATAEAREVQRRESARDHYQAGIRLFSAGDTDGARAAFERALALANEPLLRRMIQQRLEVLDER